MQKGVRHFFIESTILRPNVTTKETQTEKYIHGYTYGQATNNDKNLPASLIEI